MERPTWEDMRRVRKVDPTDLEDVLYEAHAAIEALCGAAKEHTTTDTKDMTAALALADCVLSLIHRT